MIVRNEMPKKLLKNNLLIKLPRLEEDDTEEKGLVNSEEAEGRTIVSMVSSTCTVEVGDEVMISSRAQPITSLKVGDDDYVMFRDSDVEGIW